MYTPTQWKARQGTNLNRFTKSNETLTSVDLVNNPTLTADGTPFTTDAMNNLEGGVVQASSTTEYIKNGAAVGASSEITSLSGKYIVAFTELGGLVYAAEYGGDIYKQTGGLNTFAALSQTSRNWTGLTTNGTDVYATYETNPSGGGICKQTGGTGNFVDLGAASVQYECIVALGNDIYAFGGGNVYKQTNSTGSFALVTTGSFDFIGGTVLNGIIYGCGGGGVYEFDGAKVNLIYDGVIYNNDISNDGTRLLLSGYNGSYIKAYIPYSNTHEVITADDSTAVFYTGGYLLTGVYSATPRYRKYMSGLTWKTDASFTLPEHSTGSRRRILNTGSSAITVTFPSGETLLGAGTLSVSAGAIVEIEKITDTTWAIPIDEKIPAPLTSRLLDATGDKLPATADGSIYVDNSGTQRAVNTAVTPVSWNHGKAMYANGSARMVFDSTVIGAEGTVHFYLKTGSDVTTGQVLWANNTKATARNGMSLFVYQGKLTLALCSASNAETKDIISSVSINTEYIGSITIDASSLLVTVNGISSTIAKTIVPTPTTNLRFFCDTNDTTAYFTGAACFLFTSDKQTIAQHLSWQNNPRPVFSQAVSSVPTENAIMQWGANGTFTPNMTYQTTNTAPTITAEGKYQRIGNVVYFSIGLAWTAKGTGSGYVVIGNLPIQVSSSHVCVAAAFCDGVGRDGVVARTFPSNAALVLGYTLSGVEYNLDFSDLSATGSVSITGHYFV